MVFFSYPIVSIKVLNQFIRTQFLDIVGDTLYGVYATYLLRPA